MLDQCVSAGTVAADEAHCRDEVQARQSFGPRDDALNMALTQTLGIRGFLISLS